MQVMVRFSILDDTQELDAKYEGCLLEVAKIRHLLEFSFQNSSVETSTRGGICNRARLVQATADRLARYTRLTIRDHYYHASGMNMMILVKTAQIV